jgi:hypothetical protein
MRHQSQEAIVPRANMNARVLRGKLAAPNRGVTGGG